MEKKPTPRGFTSSSWTFRASKRHSSSPCGFSAPVWLKSVSIPWIFIPYYLNQIDTIGVLADSPISSLKTNNQLTTFILIWTSIIIYSVLFGWNCDALFSAIGTMSQHECFYLSPGRNLHSDIKHIQYTRGITSSSDGSWTTCFSAVITKPKNIY